MFVSSSTPVVDDKSHQQNLHPVPPSRKKRLAPSPPVLEKSKIYERPLTPPIEINELIPSSEVAEKRNSKENGTNDENTLSQHLHNDTDTETQKVEKDLGVVPAFIPTQQTFQPETPGQSDPYSNLNLSESHNLTFSGSKLPETSPDVISEESSGTAVRVASVIQEIQEDSENGVEPTSQTLGSYDTLTSKKKLKAPAPPSPTSVPQPSSTAFPTSSTSITEATEFSSVTPASEADSVQIQSSKYKHQFLFCML